MANNKDKAKKDSGFSTEKKDSGFSTEKKDSGFSIEKKDDVTDASVHTTSNDESLKGTKKVLSKSTKIKADSASSLSKDKVSGEVNQDAKKIKKTVKSVEENLISDSKKSEHEKKSSITNIPNDKSSINSAEDSSKNPPKKMGILAVLVVLIAAYFFIGTDSTTDNEVIATTNEINSESKDSEADAKGYTEVNPNNLEVDDDAQLSADNNSVVVDGDEQSSKNDNQTNASSQDNSNVNNSTSIIVDENSNSVNNDNVLEESSVNVNGDPSANAKNNGDLNVINIDAEDDVNGNSSNKSTSNNFLIKDKTIVSNFIRGSDSIQKIDEILLDKMRSHLSSSANAKIILIGYASSDGTLYSNKILSKNRAIMVKEKLISFGFNASRISATGGGISNPISSNLTNEGRIKNRRVEITLK